jgi:hypothetical protein
LPGLLVGDRFGGLQEHKTDRGCVEGGGQVQRGRRLSGGCRSGSALGRWRGGAAPWGTCLPWALAIRDCDGAGVCARFNTTSAEVALAGAA